MNPVTKIIDGIENLSNRLDGYMKHCLRSLLYILVMMVAFLFGVLMRYIIMGVFK